MTSLYGSKKIGNTACYSLHPTVYNAILRGGICFACYAMLCIYLVYISPATRPENWQSLDVAYLARDPNSKCFLFRLYCVNPKSLGLDVFHRFYDYANISLYIQIQLAIIVVLLANMRVRKAKRENQLSRLTKQQNI